MFFAFAIVITTAATAQTTKCGGKFFAKQGVDKETLIAYLKGESDQEIMAPGITKTFWVRCFAANFEKVAGKNLGESLLVDGSISGDRVLAVLEAAKVSTASWTMGQVKSTYPCTEKATYVAFERLPYQGEMVLVYKGYAILSFACGNPLQDFRKTTPPVDVDFAAENGGYKGTIPAGAPIVINVYGSSITNSGNSGDATAFAGSPGTKKETADVGVFTPSYDPPPQYVPAGPPAQQQPTYVANTQGCCPTDPQLLRYTKQNRDANIAGAVGSWIAPFGAAALGWGLNQLFPSGGNNYHYYGNGGGFVPNGSGTIPAGNTGGFMPNGTGNFNNPFNTGNGGFVPNGGG